MNRLLKNEKGDSTIVEATLLLPFCIIMVMALFLVALFMCQKANLQANLQTALIYYKNPVSDTYVEVLKGDDGTYKMSQTNSNGTITGKGSDFHTSDGDDYKIMYRNLFSNFNTEGFEEYFREICGFMFFDNGENIEITMDGPYNYIFFKEWTVTATQTITPAINLSMLGSDISKPWTIVVTDKVVVNNGDDVIRDTDFVIDLIMNTKLGDKIDEVKDKVSEYYQKFYDKFH